MHREITRTQCDKTAANTEMRKKYKPEFSIIIKCESDLLTVTLHNFVPLWGTEMKIKVVL